MLALVVGSYNGIPNAARLVSNAFPIRYYICFGSCPRLSQTLSILNRDIVHDRSQVHTTILEMTRPHTLSSRHESKLQGPLLTIDIHSPTQRFTSSRSIPLSLLSLILQHLPAHWVASR